MQIIDTHTHYWEPNRPDRPWDPTGTNLGTPLSAEQLISDATTAGVTKVVQVTPTIMGYDNTYSFEAAERYPDRIAGVFARFDPTVRDLAGGLAELRSQPTFLGIRLTLMSAPFSDWLTDGTLDRFLVETAKQKVAVAIFAPHAAKTLGDLARRHPGATLLADHMTLSHHDAQPFAGWSEVLALADVPNLWMKVTYFPEVAHEAYPFATVQPRFKELLERFGSERLIWGSNYPPSKRACSYKENVDFTRIACDFL